MVSFSYLLNIVQILKIVFGIQNSADAQGGAQQQHLLINKRVTAVFLGRISHLSWLIKRNGTDLDLLQLSHSLSKKAPFMYIDYYEEYLWHLLWPHARLYKFVQTDVFTIYKRVVLSSALSEDGPLGRLLAEQKKGFWEVKTIFGTQRKCWSRQSAYPWSYLVIVFQYHGASLLTPIFCH